MNRAMIAAASGMSVEQTALEQISDNLSNSDTPGYKSSEAWFSALSSGLGATVGGTRLNLHQGKMMSSGGPFDLAIDGNGFFQVKCANGDMAFTRLGDFHRSDTGAMVNGQGAALVGVTIPANATDLDVRNDGRIMATLGTQHNVELGRVQLYNFAAPDQLRQGGIKGLFFASTGSGAARAVPAGGETKINFGMLEKSNISVVESMLSLLAAQRAYEADSKGVQAADEMLRIANSLQHS